MHYIVYIVNKHKIVMWKLLCFRKGNCCVHILWSNLSLKPLFSHSSPSINSTILYKWLIMLHFRSILKYIASFFIVFIFYLDFHWYTPNMEFSCYQIYYNYQYIAHDLRLCKMTFMYGKWKHADSLHSI